MNASVKWGDHCILNCPTDIRDRLSGSVELNDNHCLCAELSSGFPRSSNHLKFRTILLSPVLFHTKKVILLVLFVHTKVSNPRDHVQMLDYDSFVLLS